MHHFVRERLGLERICVARARAVVRNSAEEERHGAGRADAASAKHGGRPGRVDGDDCERRREEHPQYDVRAV